jgi:hypothetical protein
MITIYYLAQASAIHHWLYDIPYPVTFFTIYKPPQILTLLYAKSRFLQSPTLVDTFR